MTLDFAPGSTITSSIRLVQKLGEGGMGSVWVAEHLALHTQVAVKFMTQHLAASADAATRFTREARAAAQIKSPHVVQIFDHGVLQGGVPYIVMELLEGETLATFLGHRGRLSPAVTGQILAQTCRALAKAHECEVVHRDIKPDNVFLLDPDGDLFVKLLDFGVAKQMQENFSVTSTGATVGTPHYMSPEQMLSSKHVDVRADLWAVGVVAYQCLTGAVPFDGETFGGIAVAIAHDQFAPPFARRGIGSPALDAWFERALAKNREQRFGSARELSESFARAAQAPVPDPSISGQNEGSASFARTAPLLGSGVVAASGTVAPAQSAPPKTFVGVSTTMHGTGGRKKYAFAVGSFLLVGSAGAGALVVPRLLRATAPGPDPTATPNSAAPDVVVTAPGSESADPPPVPSLAPATALESAPSVAPVPLDSSPAPAANVAKPNPPASASPASRKPNVSRKPAAPRSPVTPGPTQTRPDRGF